MTWQSSQIAQFIFIVASILVIVGLGIVALRLSRRSLRHLEEQGHLSETTHHLLQGVMR